MLCSCIVNPAEKRGFSLLKSEDRGLTIVMDRKRVLFVVEAMGGGVFSYIVDLANELSKHYDMYIAYATRPQTPVDFEKYFASPVHLIKVKHFTKPINPVSDLLSVFEIKRIARTVNPSIIHLHSSKAGAIGRLAFDGKRIPVFYTPHGYSFLMKDCSAVKRVIYRTIEGIMAKHPCTTISCSAGEHKETLKLTLRARYVNNGINTVKMDEIINNTAITNHPFTVFTLGRICDQKNPKLFNLIAESMPKIRFLWIGDGELRSELKSKNIEVTGWVDRKEAIKRARNAEVFILTSMWEGLPISLIEAMYLKKKCVVSDVEGNHDVISNGENGFVCQTIEDYTNAILESNCDEIIEKAYNDVKRIYNTTIMGSRYRDIYENT